MKRKPYKPVQVIEGVWYALMDEQTSECCDCGLVHFTEWKVEKGRLFPPELLEVQRLKSGYRAVFRGEVICEH